MPHQLLLNQIDKATDAAGIEALKSMILNGRPSTNKYGLGQFLKGGIRSTEFFTGLANNENIFHLLARKNLITELLPTIESALQTVAFIEREDLKLSLGLAGRTLTPSTEQKEKFLKVYLTQKNASAQTPFDIANPADKQALGAYIPEALKSTVTASGITAQTTEESPPTKKLKIDKKENIDPKIAKIEDLAKYYKTNDTKFKIVKKLGNDYNDLEMFVYIYATNPKHLTNKVQSSFTTLDHFFDALFNLQSSEDFIHQSSQSKISSVGIACKYGTLDMATKLLKYYTADHQSQLINEANDLNSQEMIQLISTRYPHNTDWTQILFSSIKNGRHEILINNQEHLPFDSKISITKGSKNIEYTPLNYLLHTIKLMCVRAANAPEESTAQQHLTEQTNKLFACFDLIASKANLSQDQSKALSLLKQLRNFEGIYERIAENESINSLLEHINWDEQGSTVATTVGNESIRTTQSMISINDIKHQVTLLGDSGYDSADEADGF